MSKEEPPVGETDSDHVDEIVGQWGRERPNVDVSGMEVIGRLGRLQKMIGLQLDEVFDTHDLESWEFDVLATLVRTGHPNRLTPGDLLDSMMITSGAMTNRIDRLERRGFVKRSKSPDDGRQVLVALTAKGRKKADAALVDHAANEVRILEALDTSEREQLVVLLRRLGQVVEARRT